ncbi:hypothetical protein FE257_004594 [Aspergillus nanangensis]|uniref:Zn(2)-C6 fungal-type domain-containing protein n=1 Tax=Aspergillus nanangensis TaxID=2582783 RepID=A0AAD4GZP3_ASPNN|nr:hypothetical protein FE257_004594 [Aspergillus nanangensis]
MVFHGRASKSCAKCRAVKRRCDQRVPHCGQCIRQREQCPGYRDEWDLVFRDQTSHTIRRSQKKWAETAALADPHDLPPPTHSLRPRIDEIGVNHFLRHFVIGGPSPSRGYLNYVPSVYHVDGEHPALMASMAAVGLVALSNSTHQPDLASHARAKYAEAIRNVNSALASPVESIKDSTLMSVISLGVFEHVSGYESWVRHVHGAAALVVARGKRQFSSPVTIRMFSQVRADLVYACLHSTIPFPEDMLELQDEAAKYTDPSSPTWLLGVLSTRVANLLVTIRKKDPDAGIPWSEFLEETITLERGLRDVCEGLAIEEPYATTQDSGADPDKIYNGRIDRYKDAWAIRVWNNLRSLRMVVCEILCYLLNGALAKDLAPDARRFIEVKLQETLQTLSELGDDIIATVPQAMEFVSSVSEPHPSIDLSFNGSVSGGYMLTWCLYMVGKCVVTKNQARKWIIRRLQDIGSNMGISIALQLVDDIVKIDQLTG